MSRDHTISLDNSDDLYPSKKGFDHEGYDDHDTMHRQPVKAALKPTRSFPIQQPVIIKRRIGDFSETEKKHCDCKNRDRLSCYGKVERFANSINVWISFLSNMAVFALVILFLLAFFYVKSKIEGTLDIMKGDIDKIKNSVENVFKGIRIG